MLSRWQQGSFASPRMGFLFNSKKGALNHKLKSMNGVKPRPGNINLRNNKKKYCNKCIMILYANKLAFHHKNNRYNVVLNRQYIDLYVYESQAWFSMVSYGMINLYLKCWASGESKEKKDERAVQRWGRSLSGMKTRLKGHYAGILTRLFGRKDHFIIKIGSNGWCGALNCLNASLNWKKRYKGHGTLFSKTKKWKADAFFDKWRPAQ